MSNPPPPAPLPGLRLSVQSCIVWSWLMIAIVRFCHHLINPNIISKQQHKTQGRFVQTEPTAGLKQKHNLLNCQQIPVAFWPYFT